MRRLVPSLAGVFALAGLPCFGPVRVHAGVPDPTRSTVPAYVLVVGRLNGGADPDPVGLATVTVRDFTNAPRPGMEVVLDLSGCCDLAPCEAVVNGESKTFVNGRVSGFTNQAGNCQFIVLGAARDPGTFTPPAEYGGCGAHGAFWRLVDTDGEVVIGTSTVAVLDQNGAAGGSNGTTVADVNILGSLFGAVALGSPYRGRGDINQDGNITVGDVQALFTHYGRLFLANGVGCTQAYASGGCP